MLAAFCVALSRLYKSFGRFKPAGLPCRNKVGLLEEEMQALELHSTKHELHCCPSQESHTLHGAVQYNHGRCPALQSTPLIWYAGTISAIEVEAAPSKEHAPPEVITMNGFDSEKPSGAAQHKQEVADQAAIHLQLSVGPEGHVGVQFDGNDSTSYTSAMTFSICSV